MDGIRRNAKESFRRTLLKKISTSRAGQKLKSLLGVGVNRKLKYEEEVDLFFLKVGICLCVVEIIYNNFICRCIRA